MTEKIKLLADKYFDGDMEQAENYLKEYALKHLGYLKDPAPRGQRNINLGTVPEELEDFIMEISDKTNKGKYSSAILQLVEYGLKIDRGDKVDFLLLKTAKVSDIPIETMSRRIRRKKGIKFILSISQYSETVVTDFYKYCANEKLKPNEAFQKLLGIVYNIYKEM